MAGVIESLGQLKTWISARSRRELVMLSVTVIVVCYFLTDRLVLVAQAQRLMQTEQQLKIAQSIHDRAQASLKQLEVGGATNGVSDKIGIELDDLRKQARTIDAVLGNVQQGATPPVGALVKNLIATQHPRVNLVSLRTVPAKPILALGQPGSAPLQGSAAGLYRHGVEVEIAGAYLDLLAYLRALEASSRGLFWSDAKLTANNYPEVTLRLTIYILSNRPDPLIS